MEASAAEGVNALVPRPPAPQVGTKPRVPQSATAIEIIVDMQLWKESQPPDCLIGLLAQTMEGIRLCRACNGWERGKCPVMSWQALANMCLDMPATHSHPTGGMMLLVGEEPVLGGFGRGQI